MCGWFRHTGAGRKKGGPGKRVCVADSVAALQSPLSPDHSQKAGNQCEPWSCCGNPGVKAEKGWVLGSLRSSTSGSLSPDINLSFLYLPSVQRSQKSQRSPWPLCHVLSVHLVWFSFMWFGFGCSMELSQLLVQLEIALPWLFLQKLEAT